MRSTDQGGLHLRNEESLPATDRWNETALPPARCKQAGDAACTRRACACTTHAREMVVHELRLLPYQLPAWRKTLLSVILDPWEPFLKNEWSKRQYTGQSNGKRMMAIQDVVSSLCIVCGGFLWVMLHLAADNGCGERCHCVISLYVASC